MAVGLIFWFDKRIDRVNKHLLSVHKKAVAGMMVEWRENFFRFASPNLIVVEYVSKTEL
jgi:hypothetical protein